MSIEVKLIGGALIAGLICILTRVNVFVFFIITLLEIVYLYYLIDKEEHRLIKLQKQIDSYERIINN